VWIPSIVGRQRINLVSCQCLIVFHCVICTVRLNPMLQPVRLGYTSLPLPSQSHHVGVAPTRLPEGDDDTSHASLFLYSCYPFHYRSQWPKDLLVHLTPLKFSFTACFLAAYTLLNQRAHAVLSHIRPSFRLRLLIKIFDVSHPHTLATVCV
jgi:hypothetical protein